MADERDWLEKAQFYAKGRTGSEISPSTMSREFAKWGSEDRLRYLDGIDSELKDAHLSVREAARLHGYRRQLLGTHESLRKIDR